MDSFSLTTQEKSGRRGLVSKPGRVATGDIVEQPVEESSAANVVYPYLYIIVRAGW